MDDQQQYIDVIERITKLMKDTFGGNFSTYYEGDPIDIPKNNLPCVIVDEPVDRIEGDGTNTDKVTTQIRIKLVLNKADDFGASPDVDMTERRLRRFVRGRDPVTGKYLEGTILKALRTHITLGQSQVDQRIDVSYDLQPRPGGIVTSEARVSIVTTEKVIRDDEVPTI